MTPEEFRRHGHEMVDWIAEHWSTLDQRPVLPTVSPGEIRAMLPDTAPEAPESFADVLADLDRVVVPGTAGWQAPGWLAYFPSNTTFASMLGDLAAAGLGQVGLLWATSPALTELESHVLDWLVDLLGMPASFRTTEAGGGVIQGTASDSTHTCLVVARDRHPDGLGGRVAYASAQAHSSVEKGARVAGYAHVRAVPTEPGTHAMSVDALAEAMAADAAAGLVPAFVCPTVGTTGVGAVDPVRAVAEVARRHDAWVHVDAAWAGTALLCPEHRGLVDGVELADSFTFNPHKWMGVGFDCSVMWVADRAPLIGALSILPPYLRNEASSSGAVIDYRDWHVPLGRRFRALKLWMVLRLHGAEALRAMVRAHVSWAAELGERVAAHPRLDLVAPVVLGLVSLAHVDGDEATDALQAAVESDGRFHLTASVLDGRRYLRVSIGTTTTTEATVQELWRLVEAAA